MRDRTDFEPVFFAPFVSSPLAVDRDWVDRGGPVDMAHCGGLFDRAMEEAFALLGLGLDYSRVNQSAFGAAGMQKAHSGPLSARLPVRATVRLVDYDDRRLHLLLQLHHGADGSVFAVSEQVVEHVDAETRRAVPFPDDVLERIAEMRAAHAALPAPPGIGPTLGLSARS